MCPTFLVTGEEIMSTRGRANAIRAALEGRGLGKSDPLHSIEMETALGNCLSCKACTTECPSNVNLALLKTELLHARIQRDGLSGLERLFSSLDLLGKIFIDPGDLIAVEAPAYVGALTAFGAYEPRFLPIEIDDHGMIVDQLEQALVRGERPAFVYTVPNFGNPAGVTLSAARRHQLIALCREAGIPIIEDNPYGLLRFEGEAEPCLRSLDPDNVIYLGTVSKTFSPGVRVGWALAEPSVVQRLVLAKEAADLCSSNLTMLMTERWFSDEQRWRSTLAGLVETYRSRRDAMLEALEEHMPEDATWTRPGGGFYVWATLPEWLDAKALLAAAVERRVAYVPGTAFYPDGRGANRMRLAFCYPPEDRIREGVGLLGALLHDEEQLYRSMQD